MEGGIKKSEVRRTSYPRGISPNNQKVNDGLEEILFLNNDEQVADGAMAPKS